MKPERSMREVLLKLGLSHFSSESPDVNYYVNQTLASLVEIIEGMKKKPFDNIDGKDIYHYGDDDFNRGLDAVIRKVEEN